MSFSHNNYKESTYEPRFVTAHRMLQERQTALLVKQLAEVINEGHIVVKIHVSIEEK